MRPLFAILTLAACAPSLVAQLSVDQKLQEFQYLAGLYAKRYAPYEWKKETQGFDMLDLAPWLAKVRATKNDLEFFDVASEYVSRLNDGHSVFILPSDFVARLNFTVDIYDGKLLVDAINRTRLPTAEYGFVNGYELVSIDGVPAEQLVEKFERYQVAANERATRRFAASMLTTRAQSGYPFAAEVPEISSVVFRRPDGRQETYRIPWTKTGVPLTTVGKFRELTAAVQPESPAQPLLPFRYSRVRHRAVNGFGGVLPTFVNALGPTLNVRLGRVATDPFFSGVVLVGPYRIGFLRIPTFEPANPAAAITAFRNEIAFFQANTDGLVIDITRNPGGFTFLVNEYVSYLLPETGKSIGFELRATSGWVVAISSAIESARAQNAPASLLGQLEGIRDAILSANRENRGRTTPLPLDGTTLDLEPARANNGALLSYRKPLLVLTDEMSASAADMFAATLQDNGRGTLFGWRTMGLGGTVLDYPGSTLTTFTSAFLTESLMSRSRDIVTPDFPTTRYIENVGVRPDIEYDYMTRENLVRSGGAFVDAFLLAMYELIEKSR